MGEISRWPCSTKQVIADFLSTARSALGFLRETASKRAHRDRDEQRGPEH